MYLDSDESQPEIEVWEDDENSILSDVEAPEKFSSSSVPSNPTVSEILVTWILRFLIVMQATFRLSDVVLGHFLRFFAVHFRIIGRSHRICQDIAEHLPQSLY